MDFIDVIHGPITIPVEIAQIIACREFQRLKNIHQLGLLNLIVPTAKQTRYDHCIGTYIQANKMLNSLENNTAWLAKEDNRIPSIYRKAVEIAALLHDIGHGPFSHTWEQIGSCFYHEQNGLPCVDSIFATLNEAILPELRANNNYGIELIKALILGKPKSLPAPLPQQYQFIFEIVHNRQCKLDVDKWDYLKRDHYTLKHLCNPNMDFDSVFLDARVSNNGAHIEYNYKDYDKVYRLFEARWNFHVKCYRLPLNVVFDKILLRIVQRCENNICGRRMTEINANDMTAFLQLTDDEVLQKIKYDKWYSYLQDPSKIKQVQKEERDPNENIPDSMIVVKERITGPGQFMPADAKFSFYGKASDKKPIERNTTPTYNVGCFMLS